MLIKVALIFTIKVVLGRRISVGRSERERTKTAIIGSNKRKRTMLALFSIIVVGVIGVSLYTLSTKKTVDEWENKIYPGITVDNVEVGGMSKEEAKSKLEKVIESEMQNKAIIVKVDDRPIIVR